MPVQQSIPDTAHFMRAYSHHFRVATTYSHDRGILAVDMTARMVCEWLMGERGTLESLIRHVAEFTGWAEPNAPMLFLPLARPGLDWHAINDSGLERPGHQDVYRVTATWPAQYQVSV